MKIEQGEISYKNIGYSKRLSRELKERSHPIYEGQIASGDLKGHYPRPEVIWSNGTGTYDSSYVNVTGDTMTGNLLVTGRVRPTQIWHVYGGFQDAGETVACDAATWTHITNATNDLWGGTEADGFSLVDDVMTITNAGDYSGHLSITMNALQGKDFHVRLYNITQAAQVGYELGISTAGANNDTVLSMSLYIEAAAGDQFRMEINSTDGTDPVIEDAVFYLAYLHD